MTPRIRPPAVAGLFYPADPADLAAAVDALLAAVADPAPGAKALIVPHAGYSYSGTMAALGYASLAGRAERIAHVVLLGPCHRIGWPALTLPGADGLATPLGVVPVWADGVAKVGDLEGVAVGPEVHAEEHSLEVQLPFLQRILTGFDVLPLAVGPVPAETVADVLDAVWGGAETLIVISSDLSHYLPYAVAERRDRATVAQIAALDGLLGPHQACGAMPVNGFLAAARRHSLAARVLGRCSSGDTAGDRDRVVGYTAIAFDETAGGAGDD
jgi:AmmeMemoRadiSam system protein B